MNDVVSAEPGLCALHNDRRAVGTCLRCGNFYCAECYKDLGTRRLCVSCLAIPGIDYIQAIRDRYWGRRDGWIWYFGVFGSLGMLFVVGTAVTQRSIWPAIPALIAIPIQVAYFMQQRWARNALFLIMPVSIVQGFLQTKASGVPATADYTLGLQVGGALIGLLFTLAAYASTRNKLAFRIDVPERELEQLYARMSNAGATRSLAYGLLSFFVPLLGFVTFSFGVRAFRRAAPDAWPPVGGRGVAIAGMLVSLISSAIWCTAAWRLLHK